MALAVWLACLCAAPPGDATESARRILSDPDYQTELPGAGPRAPAESSRAPEAGREVSGTAARIGAGIGEALLWALVAAAAALFVCFLLASLGRRARERDGRAPAGKEVEAPAGTPSPPLGDAAEAARAGRFADAIHLLLLRAIRIASARAPGGFAASETGREIAARAPLAAPHREALRALVSAVEWTRFGGREPSAADYEEALLRFREIDRALGGGAA